MQPSYKLFPTGRRTLQFDIAEHIADQVGTITITGTAWSFPADLTEVSKSHTDSTVTVTIATSGLTLKDTYTGICSITFSDGQVHPFRIDFVVAYLDIKVIA